MSNADRRYLVFLEDGNNKYSLICKRVLGKYVDAANDNPVNYDNIYWVKELKK